MKIKEKELKTFYIFLLSQFVSQFGSRLTSYGLILWAYNQSGSVLSIALLSVSYLLPEILLNFIAGSISDRWNKKSIMLISDCIAAVSSCFIIFLLITQNMKIEYLYIINIILGITDAFQIPASEVTISLIVSKDDYIKTSGMQSFCKSFIDIFYPVIATVIYAIGGLEAIVSIDLFTFAFAFVTLAVFIKIPEMQHNSAEQESIWQKCVSGIKYIKQECGIKELILFMAFVNLIAAIYTTNLAPMILSRTINNRIQLGIVNTSIGIAGLVGSLIVARMKNVKNKVQLILNIMTFSFLICNTMLGIGRNYYIWTIAVFLGNSLIPVLMANVTYIMRTRVPIHMQGRVFSARNTLQYAVIPIGNLLGGILSDKVFEPLMLEPSKWSIFFEILVGSGNGSGIALLYVCLGIAGVLGCWLFGKNKKFRMLDDD